MPKPWRIRAHDPVAVTALERSAGVSAIVARLLAARDVHDASVARAFLACKLADLRDPELLPGVPAAADRILAAVRAGRKIAIHGDYDADGMSATAILVICLEALGADVQWFLPDRFEEGYGLKIPALEFLAGQGVSLVVTVDCGISSVAEAIAARRLGLELIITDHHAFAAELPEADVLVHPRLPGSSYPFGELCGAGVAFKLAWALATRASGTSKVTPRLKEMLLRALGYAALGTVADVMPLVDENRVLVKHGLECLRQRGGDGMGRLMELLGLNKKSVLECEDVGYRLAPRLNAAGRLGKAALGVELLTTNDSARAKELAEMVHDCNASRQELDKAVLLAAAQQADAEFSPETDAALVLAGVGWHPGVVGIVASRLAERFHRPVVVIARDENPQRPAIGSLRSVPGFDVHAALHACREHLLSHGGHAAAAGLRIDESRIPGFKAAFLAAVAERLPPSLREADIVIDAETTLAAMTLTTVEQIETLAPFGQDNPRPVLCASGVTLAEPARTMGKGDRTLAMNLLQHGAKIRGVAFGAAEWISELPEPGQPFHVAFSPKINEFLGRRTAELEIVDWRPAGIDVGMEIRARQK